MAFDFLKNLTEAERKDLHTRLSYELLGSEKRVNSQAETLLWKTVQELIPSTRRLSLDDFMKAYNGQKHNVIKYAARADVMQDLLDRAAPGAKRDTRMALRVLMGRSLIRWMQHTDKPVSGITFLNNFDFLEYAVDRAYPGYIAAGMLGRVGLMLS